MLRATDVLSNDSQEDLTLAFCTNVLHLQSLHWGYFAPGEAPTLTNLRHAQRRYSEVLASYIPSGSKTILDIGCGIGDNALLLAGQGYAITCLSPDQNHKNMFERFENPLITFQQTTIERYTPTATFDVALMSESSNYFDPDDGFRKCAQALKTGGYVLAASLLRKDDSKAFAAFHVEHEWVAAARRHGFRIKRRTDITEHMAPTCDFARDALNRFILPVLQLTDQYLRKASPGKYRMLMFLLRRQMKKLEAYIAHDLKEISDSALFRRKARYVIYLLEKCG